MRLGVPQPLEEVDHEGGGDRPATGQHAPGSAMARRTGRRSVKSSQRDHLEILVAEKISVPAAENKKIYFWSGRRNPQRQEDKNDDDTHQPPLAYRAGAQPSISRPLGGGRRFGQFGAVTASMNGAK